MKTINFRDINLGDVVGEGNFSVVRKCSFDNKEYCVKFFKKDYPKEVMNNVKALTNIDFTKQYFTPLYMVETSIGDDIFGYLMNYDENLKELKYSFSLEDKIKFLKNAQKVIKNLHIEYKRTHNDLVLENMLCDDEKNAYLLDFDASTKFGRRYKDITVFRVFIHDYLKFYPLDIKTDIYSFNVTTLMFLANIPTVNMLFECIYDNELDLPIQNKDIKRLTKELLLQDVKKSYSGEYIVDYL